MIFYQLAQIGRETKPIYRLTYLRRNLIFYIILSTLYLFAGNTYAIDALNPRILPFTTPLSKLAEKDITIILGDELQDPVRFINLNRRLFSMDWYEKIIAAYKKTSVGNAFVEENSFNEWQLVSIRISPCSPLVKDLSRNPSRYCWPQVRLVWQPIKPKIRHTWGYVYNYADDRAIHALYLASQSDTLKNAIQILSQKETGLESPSSLENELLGPFESQFITARNAAAKKLLKDTLGLRDRFLGQDRYTGFGNRPEVYKRPSAFKDRLLKFLSKYTPVQNLNEMTSFSLPSGRQPAHIDQWVFIAFEHADKGALRQVDLKVFDNKSGSEILNIGNSESVSSTRDDPKVYDIWDSSTEWIQNKIESQVLLFPFRDQEALGEKIADRNKILIPNTTCGSCHRFNQETFNFHNLSKLETDAVSISKRVIEDTKFDMKWIKENLN